MSICSSPQCGAVLHLLAAHAARHRMSVPSAVM
jgi:hypothetical protein